MISDLATAQVGKAASRIEFLHSLSPAERKLPLQTVVDYRLAHGHSVPDSLKRDNSGANARMYDSDRTERRVYQITGTSAAAAAAAIESIGETPIYVASTRPYATAFLTIDQLMAVAEHASIQTAVEISTPIPQGYFENLDAHTRTAPPAVWTDESLTGEGVVVAILSAPVKASLLTALDSTFTLVDGQPAERVIPQPAKLHQWPGVINDTFGTTDLSALLQTVYQFAPGAEIVIASPYIEYSENGTPAGISSTPAQLGDLIEAVAAGDGQVPPADIIIDDLFYPTQNPFEFDAVSEAIKKVREQQNVLYITAAGDHGHSNLATGVNTASTYVAALQRRALFQLESDPLWEVHRDNGLGGFVHGFASNGGGDVGFMSLAQDLTDLCLFWDQKPTPNNTLDDPLVFIYSANNTELAFWAPGGPGECLYGGDISGTNLPAGAKVVLEWMGAAEHNLVLQGLGAAVGTAAFTSAVVSQGGIRGHAASPDAVTVGSVKLCNDGADTPATLAFSDDACVLEAEPFTAGGQSLFQYGWQYDNTSNTWGEYIGASTDGNRPARNPNVVAVGSTVVVAPDQAGAASELAYAGTSVSAAAVAGIAALYWEHRETELANFVPPVDEGIRNQVLPDEVRAALRDAAQHEPTSPFDLAQSLILGDGAIDAPFALENSLFRQPMWPGSINPIAGVGAVEIDITKAADDFKEEFIYSVQCDGLLVGGADPNSAVSDGAFVWPSNHSKNAGEDAVDLKAPLVLEVAIGSEVTCSVTPQLNTAFGVPWTPAVGTISPVQPLDAQPVQIQLVAKALGFELALSDDADYPAGTTVTYSAACTADDGFELWASSQVNLPTTISVPAESGTVASCESVATVKYKTAPQLQKTATSTEETALTASAAELSVVPDLGGVLVSWVPDADLLTTLSQVYTLECRQSGQLLISEDLLPSAQPYFVEASDTAVVECGLTAKISGAGISELQLASDSADALPEPASTGLPIWLLYEATQRQQ